MGEATASGVEYAADSALRELPALKPPSNTIAPDAAVRTLLTGEILFQDGDPKTRLFKIESGVICVYSARRGCPREIIEFAFPGDVLGLGYLKDQIYCARALVKTQVKCLALSTLDDLVKYDDRAKRRQVETMHREFAYRRNLLINANRSMPIGRVAAFFVFVSELNKNEGRDPTIITDSLESAAVADWLALDVDSLGCTLLELQKKGLIEPCGPRGLRLKDTRGLESLANENIAKLPNSWGDPAVGSETRMEAYSMSATLAG